MWCWGGLGCGEGVGLLVVYECVVEVVGLSGVIE